MISFRSARLWSPIRRGLRLYLDKMPSARVKWFYASDVPNSKPSWYDYKKTKEPSKFVPFSEVDNANLEDSYQNNKDLLDVSEDKLFQVNLKKLELAPVYWEGPVYEVRRGLWFESLGQPLSKALTEKLEEGYKLKRPYLFEAKTKPTKDEVERLNKRIKDFNEAGKRPTEEKEVRATDEQNEVLSEKDILSIGDGKLVLFSDDHNAVIFPETLTSNFNINVIRSFSSSRVKLIGVERVQRGFTESLDASLFDNLPSNPIYGFGELFQGEEDSSLQEKKKQGEMENVMKKDIKHAPNDREIDHLVLCVHGIGQILGHKYESVNFTHSINVLRTTMKKVYQNNEKFKSLAYPEAEEDVDKSNNRIQVLPISWRHRVDFHPKQRFETYDDNKKHRLPSLAELNVDGVKPLRNILGDVVLDVLLYYEPRYIKQIFDVVVSELNRVYLLYKEKNPNFNGKVHIMGHSLGLAISFDILAGQLNSSEDINTKLDFDVESLFCVGSPVGVFKLLQQKNVIARESLPSDNDQHLVSPKCRNLYNIFHPCDPVGYRIEPLVLPDFAKLKPVEVPFALEGINTQIKGLADIGEDIQDRITKAASWFSKSKKDTAAVSVEEKASNENALGDIITTLIKSDSEKPQKEGTSIDITEDQRAMLTLLNRLGRIDYALPQGVFDISLVLALSAHVTYFEDEDTAGFIMKEILASNKAPEEKAEGLAYH